MYTMTTSANRSRSAAAIMHQAGLEHQLHAPGDDARTRDSTTHLVMSPLEVMQRLPALVSRAGLHRIRVGGSGSGRVIAGEPDFRNASAVSVRTIRGKVTFASGADIGEATSGDGAFAAALICLVCVVRSQSA